MATSVSAQWTWTGLISSDWNNGGNWNLGIPPTPVATVNIPNTFRDPVIDGISTTVNTLNISNSAKLTIQSEVGLGQLNAAQISNAGTLINSGRITASGSFVLINNSGTITNFESGNVFGTTGLITLIPISNLAIYNTGTFTNSHLLSIAIGGVTAINNEGSGVFNNAGEITIGSSSATLADAINNSNEFNNTGTLTIQRSAGIGVKVNAPGTFNNQGTLTIGSVSIGKDGIYVTGDGASFNNNGGTLDINNTGTSGSDGNGIYLLNAEFTNDGGIVNIDSTLATGIALSNESTFENKGGGTVNIGQNGGNIGSIGIDGKSTLGSIINNSATIKVDNTAGTAITMYSDFKNQGSAKFWIGQGDGNVGGHGLWINGSAEFINQGTAELLIDHVADRGINFDTHQTKFTNKGNAVVRIGENGAIGANNEGAIETTGGSTTTISNEDCAKMYLYDFIRLRSGTSFTNSALLNLNTNLAHTNLGSFTNNGIVAYMQDNAIPNTVNNDLIVAPDSGTSCFFADVLQIGNANSFTPSTIWYFDQALSNMAGTYDTGGNDFSSTSLAEGTNSLYFTAAGNGCTFNLQIDLTYSVVNVGLKTWTGSVGTSWTNACNWSPHGVPVNSDDVIIPDVDKNPIIANGVSSTVKSITVEANGKLTLNSGSVLTVQGSDSYGIENYGSITNKGTLNIFDTYSTGIFNAVGSSYGNSIGSQLTLDSIGQEPTDSSSGIKNYSTFNNGGKLQISNTVGHGIYNLGIMKNIDVGEMTLSQIGGMGIRCENAEFKNFNNCEIHVVSTNDHGIAHLLLDGFTGTADFTNTGTIKIGENGNIGGAGILCNTTFLNESVANIWSSLYIDNVGEDGIRVTDGTFTNEGNLFIGTSGVVTNISSDGIHCEGIFANTQRGSITIDYTGNHGIELAATSSLANAGDIIIGENTGSSSGDGIHHAGSGNFNNNGCATLVMGNSFFSSSTFNNEGNFVINSAEPHTNSGTFSNDGVLNYVQSTVIPNVVNNDLIITSISGSCFISNVLQFGASNDFAASTEWFSDAAMTTVAGEYDTTNNTFLVTNLVPNMSHQVYFETSGNGCNFDNSTIVNLENDTVAPTVQCLNPTVELGSDGTLILQAEDVIDYANSTDNCGVIVAASISPDTFGCQDIGVFLVAVIAADLAGNEVSCTSTVTVTAPSVPASGTRTWTGAVSDNWMDACNWNPAAVPTANNDVTIPDVTTDPVIDSTTAAVVKSILVESNASLAIKSAASLTIDNSSSSGLNIEGTVINEGTIVIDNTGGAGIDCNNSSQFTNGGTIEIGLNGGDYNISGYGIKANGTFTNKVGGAISMAENSGGGILKNTDSLFINEGTINIGMITGGINIDGRGLDVRFGLHNKVTGIININKTDNDIVRNRQGTFINDGEINLGPSGGFKSNGNGFQNESILENSGTININRVTGYGLNDDNTNGNNNVIVNNSGTINVGLSGGNPSIGDDGIKTKFADDFINSGVIRIARTENAGLDNRGTDFINSGIIEIGQVGGSSSIGTDGLYHRLGSAKFINETEGIIKIDNTVESGILATAPFNNSGTILIGHTGVIGDAAIDNQSTFANNDCEALIHIASNNIINNEDEFENDGTIIEEASGNSSISVNNGIVQNLNNGTFTIGTNNGVLTTNTNDVFWLGCVDSTWSNADNWSISSAPIASSDVIIDSTDHDPVISSSTSAVARSVTVESNSKLTIENGASFSIDGAGAVGLDDGGIVINGGTLNIDNTGTHGLSIRTGSSFTNTGTVNIGQNGGAGNITDVGIYNRATFDNRGSEINIDNVGSYGIIHFAGTFTNEATINVGQNGPTDNIGRDGILNDAVFDNNGSQINIDNTGQTGLNNNSGTFTNGGSINIGQNGETRSISNDGLTNGGTFINNGQEINIDNTGIDGIFNAAGIFNNTATINIGQNGGVENIASTGITNQGIFNHNNSQINIDNMEKRGISCLGGTFNNAASIDLGQNGGLGTTSPNEAIFLQSDASFDNITCGHIEIFSDHLVVSNGTFTNDGLLIENATGNSNITTNNGIVNNLSGGIFTIGTNNEIMVESTTSNDCEMVTPAFELGAVVDFDIIGIFSDENATVSAGVYDAGSNSFIPENPLSDSTNLYVKIDDPLGGCARIVEWMVINLSSGITCYQDSDGDNYGDPLNSMNFCEVCDTGYVTDNTDCNDNDPAVNPTPDCSSTTRTWTGYISTDWNDACNWAPNCVPTLLDEVFIPVVVNPPVVGFGTTAFAKTIEMELGVELSVEVGGELSVFE